MEGNKTTNKTMGTVYVLLSAVVFSMAGILVKKIPWSSLTINATRSIFAFAVIFLYTRVTKHKCIMSGPVVFGAVCNCAMSTTFVLATKLTSAANAIVLQFTEPIFVILIVWAFYKKKPDRSAVIACAVTFGGILCFFFDKITPGNMAGNLIAIFSGFAYSGVFLMKNFRNGDFESSLLLSYLMNIAIGIWYLPSEPDQSPEVWLLVIVLGTAQFSLGYILLSKGLDSVSPVTASLTSTLEPILNPILVAVFYGEMIGWMSVLGAALVLGSALIYNLIQIKKESVA